MDELDAKRVRATLTGLRDEDTPAKSHRQGVIDGFKKKLKTPPPEPVAPPEPESNEMPSSLRAIITDRLGKIKARLTPPEDK